ncbi:Diacylglycerol O-acyltransferase 1 [Dendrobium catenatum]|uniref:diacylglycerol O-acyltransferase n=1 Tax=Dendrobium catenatum TaxID=906689 RepID=A0A2I0WYW8_9ASPA|nr:Diacylglycerol O-acyltransferase 1 [Dendrobium catenatum]
MRRTLEAQLRSNGSPQAHIRNLASLGQHSRRLSYGVPHVGLFNLCIVVLIAVNSRLTIENLMKYGLLIRSGFWFSSKSLKDWPLFVCWLTLPAFPIAAFLIEKLAWRKLISEPVVVSLHILITSLEILYPVLVILKKQNYSVIVHTDG